MATFWDVPLGMEEDSCINLRELGDHWMILDLAKLSSVAIVEI